MHEAEIRFFASTAKATMRRSIFRKRQALGAAIVVCVCAAYSVVLLSFYIDDLVLLQME